MSRKVAVVWDGDSYPVFRFELWKGGAVRDLSNIAVWFDVYRKGVFVARRPGRIATPPAGGIAECFMRSYGIDNDGTGTELMVQPFVCVPYTESGAQATNLLLNPGLDTFVGVNPNRIPANWTLVGVQTSEIFDGYENDPKPPSMQQGQAFWLVNTGGTCDTYLEQSVAQAVNPGDYVTFGAWVRKTCTSNAVGANNNWAVEVGTPDASDNVPTQIAVGGDLDWNFYYATARMTQAHAAIVARLRYKGLTADNPSIRFDSTCMFLGRYKTMPLQPVSVKVLGRVLPARTLDQIAGVGGFERDSDGDGFPDGIFHQNGTGSSVGGQYTIAGVTYSLTTDPANVYSGRSALKVVMAGSGAGSRFAFMKRRHYKAGETWRMGIRYKTLVALSAQPTISLTSDSFSNGQLRVLGAATSLPTNQPNWTEYTADIVFTSDCEGLFLNVNLLTGNTGTCVFDAMTLKKV